MKKLFISFLIALMPISSFAWIPQMYFQVTPQYAQVQVTNPSPFNAFCQGYVFGMTQMGFPINSWFSAFVPAYGYQFAYIYAYPPYFFTNSWAQIQCN